MVDRPIIFSGPMVQALLDGRKTQTRRKTRLQPFVDDAAICRMIAGTSVRIRPGDRLWVREAWAAGACAGDMPPGHLSPRFWRVENGGLWYMADGAEPAHPITPRGKKRSSIHMPRWASRLTLTVTGVRVQRLQEISEEDAIAEGVALAPIGEGEWWVPDQTNVYPSPVLAFFDLWDSIHGAGTWSANPWAAAVSFTVQQRNIDHA